MSAALAQAQDLVKRLFTGAIQIIEAKIEEEVWEYAEREISLSSDASCETGPVRLRQYQKGKWSPFWAFKRYRRVSCLWATQTGKTLLLQLCLCYIIKKDPGPTMIVFPNQMVAKRRSKKHLRPLINQCLKEFLPKDLKNDMNNFEYMLINMSIILTWAGSAAGLSGEPIRNLFMDEKAKFEKASDTEADAESLARERTNSYGKHAREFDATTPTTESEPGWKTWKNTTQCQNYVPCWKCGEEQVMYFSDMDRKRLEPDNDEPFKGGIKWDRDPTLNLQQRIESAHYVCRFCEAHWNERQRKEAVDKGRWLPKNAEAIHYSSHMPAWYAPANTFADQLDLWFAAKGDPDAYHNFMNSRAAIPYERASNRIEPKVIKAHILEGLKNKNVPKEATTLILTADIHKSNIRYRVRAWAPDHTSWGIEEGHILTTVSRDGDRYDIPELKRILDKTYSGRAIDHCIIDSGWNTDAVYRFCLAHPGRAYPSKGGGNSDLWKPTIQNIFPNPEDGFPNGGSIHLLNYNTHRMQSQLASRLMTPSQSPGYWFCEEEITDTYCNEMVGKALQTEKKKGRMVEEWVMVGTHEDHARDTEMLQELAILVYGIKPAPEPPKSAKPVIDEATINPVTGKPFGSESY